MLAQAVYMSVALVSDLLLSAVRRPLWDVAPTRVAPVGHLEKKRENHLISQQHLCQWHLSASSWQAGPEFGQAQVQIFGQVSVVSRVVKSRRKGSG